MKNKQYLTPYEVAELLLVSPVTVRQWAAKGMIKALTTPGGHRRFDIAEVRRFAQQRQINLRGDASAKIRVLVIDDDPHVCRFVEQMFQQQFERRSSFQHLNHLSRQQL